MSEFDLFMRAVEGGRFKLAPDEILIVKGDMGMKSQWAQIAVELGRLVIQLPHGITLEKVTKKQASDILKAIIETA